MNINKLFDHTNAIQTAAELAMKDACGIMSEAIGTEVIAIRRYGVMIADEAWLSAKEGAYSVLRNDDTYPYEVRCDIDGIMFYSLTADEQYAAMLKEEDDG